jgi:hypothetical protein
MQNRSLSVVLKGLFCFGLLMQSPMIQADIDDVSTVDQIFIGVGVVSAVAGAWCGYAITHGLVGATTGALIAGSVVKGVHNIRYYNQILAQCEFDYGLLHHHVDWLQYPLQLGQNAVCLESAPINTTHRADHELCMSEVQKKISLFDVVDAQAIWKFEKFKDTFPHTDFQSAYCVSKSYVGLFGYPTVGTLKSAVAYQLTKIEADFNTLKSLTSLSWSDVKIPISLDTFNQFKGNLLACSHYYGAYAWLGAFGLSSVHNGQRVKDCLLSLAKIHTFLMNFQELLNTCVDSDDTELISAQGLLNFSVQHARQVPKKL